jgi:hypothetical protein
MRSLSCVVVGGCYPPQWLDWHATVLPSEAAAE